MTKETSAGAGSSPDGLDYAALTAPVRRMLGDDAAEILGWRCEPLSYTDRTPVSGGVYRVAGDARSGGAVRAWSLVLKIARSPAGRSWPDGRRAPHGWGTDLTHTQYWRREAEAYCSGLLDRLAESGADGAAGGLVVPRCFGVVAQPDDALWLWLETIQETEQKPWSVARYGVAARHLGQWSGAYLAGVPLPAYPWLNRGFLRAWAAETADLSRIASPETWTHPVVRDIFPAPVAERLLRLDADRGALLGILDRLPQTLCHLDAFGGNLLARRNAAGAAQTVALDWAFVGIAAAGEDAGQLIACSLLFGQVPIADAAALRNAVVRGYVVGLRDAGGRGGDAGLMRTVEAGAAIAAALRWAIICANGAIRAASDDHARTMLERNMGMPFADALAQRAGLVYFLLDWLDDARAMSLRFP